MSENFCPAANAELSFTEKERIPAEALSFYEEGKEWNRLRTGLGLIEFERTKELLLEFLPKPPAVLYDVGGGYGEYSWWLSSLGYEVYLFDLSETNMLLSEKLAPLYPGTTLKRAVRADARSLPVPDSSADAILFMGPMYHIVEKEERRKALAECFRALKPGGLLFTAAITRYATLLWASTVYGKDNELLGERAFYDMTAHEIRTGDHIRPNPNASSYRGIGRSYFHLPNELAEELEEAGYAGNDVRGVVGCGWLVPNLDEIWEDPEKREAVMRAVRLVEKEESLLGLSTHLLAVSRKL